MPSYKGLRIPGGVLTKKKKYKRFSRRTRTDLSLEYVRPGLEGEVAVNRRQTEVVPPKREEIRRGSVSSSISTTESSKSFRLHEWLDALMTTEAKSDVIYYAAAHRSYEACSKLGSSYCIKLEKYPRKRRIHGEDDRNQEIFSPLPLFLVLGSVVCLICWFINGTDVPQNNTNSLLNKMSLNTPHQAEHHAGHQHHFVNKELYFAILVFGIALTLT